MDKIPMEYGHTYPIPSRAAGIANFVIEYYPRGFTNALGPYDLHEPEWSQTFGVTGSSASACVQLHAFGTTKVLGVQNTSERPGSAKDDFILWRDLESLSKHYFSGDHLDHAGQGTAVEFLDDFQKLAQPGFLPVYYRMSPGFWEWLRTETGRSIPAA